MRHVFFVAFGLAVCLAASADLASQIGLPTGSFAQTWSVLPTDHFTPANPPRPFKLLRTRTSDAALGPVLDDAFASAQSEAERRGIALSEMTAPWDQPKRTAFQRLREAEASYAGADDARHARFVAMLARVVDGTGRSAAVDGSASADLDRAYAAARDHAAGDRAGIEATQKAWQAYRDAFAAFADLQTPGAAAGVTAELARQRANDLAAR